MPRQEAARSIVKTYVVDCYNSTIVLEHHDLVFGVASLGALPFVYGHLDSF
jgi:hypothetical protein